MLCFGDSPEGQLKEMDKKKKKKRKKWTNWENLFATYMISKILFLVCRKCLQINKNMKNLSGEFKKGHQYLIFFFFKEDPFEISSAILGTE